VTWWNHAWPEEGVYARTKLEVQNEEARTWLSTNSSQDVLPQNVSYGTKFYDIHAGPDLDLAYELAKNLPYKIWTRRMPLLPICKYAGVYFNGAWWKTGELCLECHENRVRDYQELHLREMAGLIILLGKLLINPGFDTRSMERSDQVVRYDMEVSPICHYILKSMESMIVK
jgi:hypothetical protein